MSLHIFHDRVSGVYCHGVWYKCKPGSFLVDAYEVQIDGGEKDILSGECYPANWVYMHHLRPEGHCSYLGASWIDPQTQERVSVYMNDISAFKETGERKFRATRHPCED